MELKREPTKKPEIKRRRQTPVEDNLKNAQENPISGRRKKDDAKSGTPREPKTPSARKNVLTDKTQEMLERELKRLEKEPERIGGKKTKIETK